MNGRDGNDSLNGGLGADNLIGSLGNDVLYLGGNGSFTDVVNYLLGDDISDVLFLLCDS